MARDSVVTIPGIDSWHHAQSLEDGMPLVRIDMLAGRSREAKDALIANVTRAVIESVGCPLDAVTVILYEVDKADWARGGVSHAKRQQAAQV